MKKQTKPKVHFYRKKPFLWTVGVIVGLIAVILIAFRVSPWPGALLIRAVFSENDVKVLSALQKHTSSIPVTQIANQQYRLADEDAFVDVYFPENTSTRLPTIIWTHGGAWVSGDKANASPFFELLAAAGFTVVVPNYSLAPEHTYPKAVHQLNDLYAYVQDNADRFHIDPTKFVLAGDSAGAQLTSQIAAIITDPAYAAEVGVSPNLQPSQVRGVVLYCGIYKMHELTQPDPTLPKIVGWGTDVSVWAYAGTRDFSDPVMTEMSAYYNVTPNFPVAFISGGNGDPLTAAQSVPFVQKLQSLGVHVTTLFYPADHQPSLPHEYQFNLDNTDGANAFTQTVQFVKARTE